jgi:hypothetical protein
LPPIDRPGPFRVDGHRRALPDAQADIALVTGLCDDKLESGCGAALTRPGSSGEHERGGVLGDSAGGFRQHAGVGVGGQDDRRVAELVLDDFQVCPGGQ